jgi:penicillin-binding protein 2
VGRTGAEAVYEDRLRGRDGKELVEVDAHGSIMRTLGRDREKAGQDIMLSVDIALQAKVAENFPKDQKGAVVVSKPSTGELLALYSSPSFDLNMFSSGLSQQSYNDLVANLDQPLFDRAIGGVYPPGSTFKLVTSLAALEEGVVKKDTTVDDVGVLKIGPFSFPNWYFLQYGKTEGLVDIVKALGRSNDIFFYKTGEWVGITKLALWAL